LQRLRVLLKAAPTWLAAVAAVLGVIAAEVVPNLPDNLAAKVGGVVAFGLSIVAAATAVVRRVTPVLPPERGILPPPAPKVETH
jgi:hypothetical protein